MYRRNVSSRSERAVPMLSRASSNVLFRWASTRTVAGQFKGVPAMICGGGWNGKVRVSCRRAAWTGSEVDSQVPRRFSSSV